MSKAKTPANPYEIWTLCLPEHQQYCSTCRKFGGHLASKAKTEVAAVVKAGRLARQPKWNLAGTVQEGPHAFAAVWVRDVVSGQKLPFLCLPLASGLPINSFSLWSCV